MTQTKLSLEDKVKPYLILAKATQAQIVGMQDVNTDVDVSEKEQLITKTLQQMLFQITFDDFEVDSSFLTELGFNVIDFKELDKKVQLKGLENSNLVDSLRIKQLMQTALQNEK